MLVDTKLIAVCGMNGVGKSALVAELEQRQALPDCAYLSQPQRTDSNAALLRRYAWQVPGEQKDSRDFAEAMGIALAYDYLEFYDNAVRQLLGKQRFIVCDGYITCLIVYLKSIRSSFPIEASCVQVKRQDLSVYVQAPTAVVDRKLSGRAFHEAYLEWLPHYSPDYCIVDNSGTIAETAGLAGEALRRHFAGELSFISEGEI